VKVREATLKRLGASHLKTGVADEQFEVTNNVVRLLASFALQQCSS
jgi:hypothetical protein